MFRINSESELLKLLKVVSEEAVKKSKKTLNEVADTAQERYINNLRASESTYGVGLTEQEEADAAEKEDSAEPTEEETPETEPAEELEEIDPETLGVSFDSVVKDINTLRSGRSTKDKEIKEELLGYYDRLDEDERKILHLFLSEISKILQGAIEAAEAQDPSDPPFNAEITFGEDEEGGDATPSGEQSPAQTEPTGQTGGEDTRPPIKVNESQDLKEIRKRVKRLMKRF